MNPIERGRKLINTVRTGAEKAIDRTQDAVGNAVDNVKDAAAAGGRKVGQFVDGFENAVSGTARGVGNVVGGAARGVQEFFGGGNQPDRVHDGKLLGADGATFPPGTPLADIPGVTPANNPNPQSTVLYVNGILTTKEAQSESLQAIANATGSRVVGIHNATEGMGADLAQCVKDKLDKGTNPAVDTLADALYTELKAGRDVHLMAHSQGGLVSSRALNDVYNRLRIEDGMSKQDARALMGKINVETFGGAAATYPDGPNYVHYVNRGDPVPSMFGLGPIPDKWNPIADGGKGSKVHQFNEFHLNPFDGHSFEDVYLKNRVPFDQAREGNFNK
ncbi:hypothetical protein JKA73_09670 [Myxococcus xanthus]|uniref:hypothetical protein n=1 Tax=Myxococcus xanthus TaxID=34 RepID=UPI001916D94A|nr:hypothetical protein [Myxococcus xanthus]QQR46330.1 hypothetical protein JKA73_09670 [Myxococcus xanthus]